MKMEIYDMESKKYVDFDKVITTYKTFGHLNLHNVLEAFNEIPAADVRPVRRGWWIGTHDGFYYSYSCSECGYEALYKENTKDQVCSDFCPNCGADMREITNE
jgi:hypothetical protein